MTHKRKSPSEIDQTETRWESPAVALHLGPELGKRLSKLMKAKGLTDRELGERSLMSRTAIYNLRHGYGANVGISTIYNIAKALGVKPCWLAFGEGQGPEI